MPNHEIIVPVPLKTVEALIAFLAINGKDRSAVRTVNTLKQLIATATTAVPAAAVAVVDKTDQPDLLGGAGDAG